MGLRTDVEDVDHGRHRHDMIQDNFKGESSCSCAHNGTVQPVVPKMGTNLGRLWQGYLANGNLPCLVVGRSGTRFDDLLPLWLLLRIVCAIIITPNRHFSAL